jgi:hypothetical protein
VRNREKKKKKKKKKRAKRRKGMCKADITQSPATDYKIQETL